MPDENKQRILFVEDEPDRYEWLEMLMAMRGYDFEILDADSAYEELRNRGNIDLVMLDVIMPVGELFGDEGVREVDVGIEFYKRVRDTIPERFNRTKFLFYSNLRQEDANARGLNIPYVRKTAEPTELMEVIERTLNS